LEESYVETEFYPSGRKEGLFCSLGCQDKFFDKGIYDEKYNKST
jgi:hypothetical protein